MRSGRILLAGDHLLAHISSNPLLSRPLAPGAEERPRALMNYLDSMALTRELPAGTLVLGGHGEPVTDHVALIDERRRMHDGARARSCG